MIENDRSKIAAVVVPDVSYGDDWQPSVAGAGKRRRTKSLDLFEHDRSKVAAVVVPAVSRDANP